MGLFHHEAHADAKWHWYHDGIPSTFLTLGTFLGDIEDPLNSHLNPHKDATTQLQAEDRLFVVEDDNVKDLMEATGNHTLGAGLGSSESGNFDSTSNKHFEADSAKRVEYKLADYMTSFETIVRDPTAKTWFHHMKDQTIFMVVGFQVLYDPNVSNTGNKNREINDNISLPVSKVFGAYLPLLRGASIDPSLKVDWKDGTNMLEAYQAMGNRIFGIRVVEVPEHWIRKFVRMEERFWENVHHHHHGDDHATNPPVVANPELPPKVSIPTHLVDSPQVESPKAMNPKV